LKNSSEFLVPSSELKTSSVAACLTPDLAGNTHAESGASELPAPALPSGAEISTALALLHEQAARHAELAAQFARVGDRRNARAHLAAAGEQLNEAELEA